MEVALRQQVGLQEPALTGNNLALRDGEIASRPTSLQQTAS